MLRWFLVLFGLMLLIGVIANKWGAPGDNSARRRDSKIQGPAATAQGGMEAEMRRLAKLAQVRVEHIELEGDRGRIHLSWLGGNAARGGDFLIQCVEHDTLLDVDIPPRQWIESTPQGKRVFHAVYNIRY